MQKMPDANEGLEGGFKVGKYKKDRPRITDLPLHQQKIYRDIEGAIQPLIAQRRLNRQQGKSAHAGRGKVQLAREQIANILEVPIEQLKDRTLLTWIEKYEERMQDPQYADKPERWVEALIPNPGRPLISSVLTEEQRIAIKTALLQRSRDSVYQDGTIHTVDLPVEMLFSEDVYEYAQALCPDLPSLDTVRREFIRLQRDEPAYYKTLLEGIQALHRDAAPKRKLDIDAVDEVWIFDAVYPPIFVQHMGKKCRCVMIDLKDLFSDYRIHHRVFPLININGNDEVENVDFKIGDIAGCLATSMWKMDRRPSWFYSDRDARFRHIRDKNYLQLLTLGGEETPIRMHLGRVKEPWSRGAKETDFWKQLHKFLRRFPGYYGPGSPGKRRVEQNITDVSELLTIEGLEENFKTFQARINERISPSEREAAKLDGRKAQTREQIYHGFVAPNPSPPIRRLSHLPCTKEDDWCIIDHKGFRFDGMLYAPYVTVAAERPMLYLRWMNAVVARKPRRYYAILLDRIGWRVEIDLDGVWYTAMPRSQITLSNEEHMEARFIAGSLIEQQIEKDQHDILQEALKLFGDLPLRMNTEVSDVYIMPEQLQQKQQGTYEDTQPEPAESASLRNSPAPQTAPKPKTKPKNEPIDWLKQLGNSNGGED